jgi:hypothetical protein
MPSPESSKLKDSSNRNPSPKSMAGKNSERKSNGARGSSEGGEDSFPGCCRKERAGECAAAEADQWGKIPRPKVFHAGTKVFHVDTKIIYLRANKFICAQINPPCGGSYLRANKNLQIRK